MAFVDSNAFLGNTLFAYEGIVGLGYNIDSQWRVALEGRYVGTTNANVVINGVNVGVNNSNIIAMVYGQYKFAPPVAAAPPPAPQAAAPPSFMVFFDWDSSSLSEASLNVVRQASTAFKSKGSARIRATGHTDTSGPEAYNMALSLRRANAVKDALVRDGVPAAAITVIGRGEAGLLVKIADGVCASRRTVASRSSSTRRSFRPRDSRRSKIAAPRVISPGRLTPHLDGIGDELQLAVGYGRSRTRGRMRRPGSS